MKKSWSYNTQTIDDKPHDIHLAPGHKVHFMGIGGIGMSALAQILLARGLAVSGCDIAPHNDECDLIRSRGGTVYTGHGSAACLVEQPDLVVYSSAISPDNPELLAFVERGTLCVHRSILLDHIMKEQTSIAVTGSHGKTTTSGLLAHLLVQAGYDPTAIIGGIVPTLGSNARIGSSPWLIAEADESDRSFENLHPLFAIITNIDREHLDVYTSEDIVIQAFGNFIQGMEKGGTLVLNRDDAGIARLKKQGVLDGKKIVWYSAADNQAADLLCTHAVWRGTHWLFDVFDQRKNEHHEKIEYPLGGVHMLSNAVAALTLCLDINLNIETLRNGLATFQSVDRRFTTRKMFQGAPIIDDYGHHPTEIAAVFKTALDQRKQQGNLYVFFQPHRYSRTAYLWDDFVRVLGSLPAGSELVMTDIFAASENSIDEITGERLLEQIRRSSRAHCTYVPWDCLADFVRPYLIKRGVGPNDVILFLGAGKINCFINYL